MAPERPRLTLRVELLLLLRTHCSLSVALQRPLLARTTAQVDTPSGSRSTATEAAVDHLQTLQRVVLVATADTAAVAVAVALVRLAAEVVMAVQGL